MLSPAGRENPLPSGKGNVNMRLLYVTDSLMAGGIESQLADLVTRLDRVRFEPRILCLYGERTRGLHFAPQIERAGIPLQVLDIGWGSRDKLQALRQIIGAVRELRPSVVQAEGYHANLLTRLARPWLPRGTKLIGTVRGAETAKQLFYERLSWWLCARLVASGPHLKQALLTRAGVPETRVVVIPNAVDVARFASPPKELSAIASPASGAAALLLGTDASIPVMNGRGTASRPEGRLVERAAPGSPATALRRSLAPNGEHVLVSVGRISRQKSMHLIPEALGILKRQGRLPANVRVCIVGQVEYPQMQAQLEEAVRREGLEGVIIQHTETQHPEEYYWASDASILFTRLEGISIAMLESLAAGRPVLLSDEANAAGVIEDGVTGWVARTGDTAHLADVLARVLALPDAALAAMRDACVRRAVEYSIERLVARYAALYEGLAPTRRD
jgi:glycosyltransferase involved in cell wall biosynthesis